MNRTTQGFPGSNHFFLPVSETKKKMMSAASFEDEESLTELGSGRLTKYALPSFG